MSQYAKDRNRAQRVRTASNAVFTALTDVALDEALEALARVAEEFRRAQGEPGVLSADDHHLRARLTAAPAPAPRAAARPRPHLRRRPLATERSGR